ncbi:beta-ketoacyl-[acyl-carrier-protein] synthase family protein [Leucothrix pacifica]|uniref:Nodulation protein E n=1 Tax=Leucothrix pacifica TaxID=1247513 RepID=A0A317C1M7_9GAMM|nr:beta-ketoacyl-[acyl-carrier-protein] synthase family protein [Leucothrix pacifica]PWQ92269.1 hypothetical protein DKW60_22030 [Leucothrix pacifica]
MLDKIVVTGMGIINSAGNDISSFWNACLQSQSNVSKVPERWNDYAKYNSGIWSPLPTIDYKGYGFGRIEIMQRDPVSLLAMIATQQALQQAGVETVIANEKKNQFSLDLAAHTRTGIFIGSGIGGAHSFLENQAFQMLSNTKKALMEDNVQPEVTKKLIHPPRVNPFSVSMLMPNSVSAAVGIKYSIRGINQTICQACSSGTTAIGQAYQAIKNGTLDFAICGGAEYLYDDYGGIYRGFDIARTLAQPSSDINIANRPFDRDRTGFLLSQGGSGILILEKESAAIKRGAEILAQITGYAETFDAYSMMSLEPSGGQIKSMIHHAMTDAQLVPTNIDYINTHGTGTKLNDQIESMIIEELFGQKPIINASKSITGHAIGASGAMEAVISVLSLQNQTTHPCNNLVNPIRDLNFVTEVKDQQITNVLSQSFAFGGHNSALILSAY